MMVRVPGFFDRSGDTLRCRECGWTQRLGVGTVGQPAPCFGCSLESRVPTLEESEWPSRKDADDPMRGVPTTDRRQGETT